MFILPPAPTHSHSVLSQPSVLPMCLAEVRSCPARGCLLPSQELARGHPHPTSKDEPRAEAGSGTWSVSARGHPPDSFLGLRIESPSLGRTRPLQVSLPPFLSPKLRGCAVGLGVQPGVGLAHWELSSQLHQDCCSERLRAPARALCFPVLPVPGPQCPSRLPPAGDSEAAFRWMQWSRARFPNSL